MRIAVVGLMLALSTPALAEDAQMTEFQKQQLDLLKQQNDLLRLQTQQNKCMLAQNGPVDPVLYKRSWDYWLKAFPGIHSETLNDLATKGARAAAAQRDCPN